eukprot:GHVN01043896.1.p1 GENE.GHVN01043896.1~~GHVN01043896.1.p1  ORF type:complete len:143 (-),score=18.97 GHVN01043896.1:495-923(-)
MGGGGVNKAFAQILKGHDMKEYPTTHSRYKTKSLPANTLTDLGSDRNLTSCFAFATSSDGSSSEGYVFIDVFRKGKEPLGHSSNIAMVYVVGPKWCKGEPSDTFLQRVNQTAKNIFLSIVEYNRTVIDSKYERKMRPVSLVR